MKIKVKIYCCAALNIGPLHLLVLSYPLYLLNRYNGGSDEILFSYYPLDMHHVIMLKVTEKLPCSSWSHFSNIADSAICHATRVVLFDDLLIGNTYHNLLRRLSPLSSNSSKPLNLCTHCWCAAAMDANLLKISSVVFQSRRASQCGAVPMLRKSIECANPVAGPMGRISPGRQVPSVDTLRAKCEHEMKREKSNFNWRSTDSIASRQYCVVPNWKKCWKWSTNGWIVE